MNWIRLETVTLYRRHQQEIPSSPNSRTSERRKWIINELICINPAPYFAPLSTKPWMLKKQTDIFVLWKDWIYSTLTAIFVFLAGVLKFAQNFLTHKPLINQGYSYSGALRSVLHPCSIHPPVCVVCTVAYVTLQALHSLYVLHSSLENVQRFSETKRRQRANRYISLCICFLSSLQKMSFIFMCVFGSAADLFLCV